MMGECTVMECAHDGRLHYHGVCPWWKNALSWSVPMMEECTITECAHDGRMHCHGVCP